eukprot:gene11064-12897_t
MSVTLEDAIRKARVSVDIDSSSVTIERDQMQMRPDGGLSRIGKYALDHMNDTHSDSSYDAKFWREKCAVLVRERKEIEAQLSEKVASVLTKYENLGRYTRMLEQRADASGKRKRNALDSESVDIILEKLQVFELLTGTTIEAGDNSDYICTVKNPLARKATRFTLQCVQHPDGDVLVHPKGNVRFLPEYLQQGDIVCDQSTVPQLLGDVLQGLYKEDETR